MVIGTVANATAIIVGGAVGLLMAKYTKSATNDRRISESVIKVLGLSVVLMGIHMTMAKHNYFPVVICLAAGTALGEVINIERQVERFGEWLQKKIGSKSDTFVTGFVSTSILFCVGATAVLGSLNDGIRNDPSLLYIKSILDGITAGIFASTMGVGVLFSALPILIYQGGISLGASQLTFMVNNETYINGISVAGGVIVVGIGLNVMKVAQLRIASTLPALLLIVVYDAIAINLDSIKSFFS